MSGFDPGRADYAIRNSSVERAINITEKHSLNRLLGEPKERTHNLETWSVCGDEEVGKVGHDSSL